MPPSLCQPLCEQSCSPGIRTQPATRAALASQDKHHWCVLSRLALATQVWVCWTLPSSQLKSLYWTRAGGLPPFLDCLRHG